MRIFLTTLVVLLATVSLSAKTIQSEFDYDFNQERMIVDHGEIFLISSLSNEDGVTVYNFNGQRLWETRFHAKIISWDVQPDVVLIFSKDRLGLATYLTCLDRFTGRLLWQKP